MAETAAKAEPKSLPYKLLTQTHPSYDAAFYEEITDLYVGGYRIARKAKTYLHQLVNEHAKWYDDRVKTAGYQPFVSQVIDQFVAELFGQPLNVQPAADASDPDSPGKMPDTVYYGQLSQDADGAGHPFVDILRSAMTTALMKGPLLVAIDAPALDPGAQRPANRAVEKDLGLDVCYVYDLPPEALIDWALDERGRFTWCIVHAKDRPRSSPVDNRNITVETFTIWSMTPDGKAAWDRYELPYTDDKPPEEETRVPHVAGDVTSFDRIPIIRRMMPDGFCIGARIGPMQREHYQRRSALISAENKSLVAIPVISLGSEIGAPGGELPSETQQDPGRGKNPVAQFSKAGFTVTGAGDKIYFAEPGGHCYELVDRQLEVLREAMLQVNHQMALAIRPTGKSIGRSGASKEKDGENTEKVLRALGHEVREFAVEIYDTIAQARGEDVVWAAHGLDTFESDDRKDMLEEAILIQQILANIPSATFRKEFVYQAAKKLMPGLGPETMSQIRTELIIAGQEIDEHADLMRDANAGLLIPPDDAGSGGGGGGKGASGGSAGGSNDQGHPKKPVAVSRSVGKQGRPTPTGRQGRDPQGHFD
jgi:hypothetical protein